MFLPRLKCLQGCIPSGGLREGLFPCLSQLLEAACIPWLVGPFHLQSQQWLFSSLSDRIALTLTLLPSLSLLTDLCDYTGSPWIILQANIPVLNPTDQQPQIHLLS